MLLQKKQRSEERNKRAAINYTCGEEQAHTHRSDVARNNRRSRTLPSARRGAAGRRQFYRPAATFMQRSSLTSDRPTWSLTLPPTRDNVHACCALILPTEGGAVAVSRSEPAPGLI